MIPRILVPNGARLSDEDIAASTRRRPSTLDERTLVPSSLPMVKLDGKSNIPTNLPLDSIATRVVVPRDVNDPGWAPTVEACTRIAEHGEKVGDNPWNATTLEWQTPTPPPHGNFLKPPHVHRGPYEYSVPGHDTDFTPQNEPVK